MTDTSIEATGTVHRAWALRLLWLVLLVSAGLAGWLAWSHLHLTHGVGAFESGCSIDATFDCDRVNTSDWSELIGIPISLYALPVYAAMAWFAGIGTRDSHRGARARGLLTMLAGLNLIVSLYLLAVMVLEIGAFCAFCLTLDALHLLGFILVVLPPGGRRPAIPEGLDLFAAAFVAVFVMATTFKFTAIYGARLDRVALAEVMGDAAATPAGVAVQTEARAGAVTRLPSERHDVPIDKYDPSWGPRKAEVIVVEFADFECGYCRRLSHTMARLREKYQERVRFVFKHYPMDQECNKRLKRQHHPSACEAARAAICAHDQRAFEAYHDLLFQNQQHLERSDLLAHAKRLKLEMGRFEGCLDGDGSLEQLREDISHAGYIDISGTPRTFVNGLMFKGAASEALLDAAIRAELGEAEVKEDGRVVSEREVVTDKPLPPGETPMVEIAVDGSSFWMDAVEASVDGEGRARAVARVAPHTRSWTDAQAACQAAGKRMCTVEEWMTACQGAVPIDDDQSGSVLDDPIEGRSYPYGAHYAQGFCHDSGDKDRQSSVPAGSKAACRSPEGAYDLTGNLQEWVGSSPEDAVVMGGAWYYDDQASCGRSGDTYGADWSSRTTGFRCCADSEVPLSGSGLDLVADNAGLAEGASVPAFELNTLGGGRVTQDILEGKVTLVAFWASWCGPCRRELPALSKAHQELEQRGFQVLAVNVDKEVALAKRFLGGGTPPYPVLLDPTSFL
ncbi:MAG TPA: hypothetical protein DFR83_00705, partial [Deltaproteobacteria bacterium]|nr:hypothetical protein [Deltaproteobacteria bacterium]